MIVFILSSLLHLSSAYLSTWNDGQKRSFDYFSQIMSDKGLEVRYGQTQDKMEMWVIAVDEAQRPIQVLWLTAKTSESACGLLYQYMKYSRYHVADFITTKHVLPEGETSFRCSCKLSRGKFDHAQIPQKRWEYMNKAIEEHEMEHPAPGSLTMWKVDCPAGTYPQMLGVAMYCWTIEQIREIQQKAHEFAVSGSGQASGQASRSLAPKFRGFTVFLTPENVGQSQAQ